MPLSPPLVLEAGSGTKFQLFPFFNIVGPFLGLTRNLGAHHAKCCNKRIHQICNHITFTDMSDSWLIYLLYIWWEIDSILVLIVQ
jgi:hypothetical protein